MLLSYYSLPSAALIGCRCCQLLEESEEEMVARYTYGRGLAQNSHQGARLLPTYIYVRQWTNPAV